MVVFTYDTNAAIFDPMMSRENLFATTNQVMSLMNIANSVGPKKEHCGTPVTSL